MDVALVQSVDLQAVQTGDDRAASQRTPGAYILHTPSADDGDSRALLDPGDRLPARLGQLDGGGIRFELTQGAVEVEQHDEVPPLRLPSHVFGQFELSVGHG